MCVCIVLQDVESGSQNPETAKEIACTTIDEAVEVPVAEVCEQESGSLPVSAPKTKPKAPLPPASANHRSVSDAKHTDAPSGGSHVISTTAINSTLETPVPVNEDASKSDTSVETSKPIEAKAPETPSKRKAPSKPQRSEQTKETANLSCSQLSVDLVPIPDFETVDHVPDTSHVSIVTIDDNGKDVTITTTSHVDEITCDEDEGHADDSFNSFSSSSRSSEAGKVPSSGTPVSLHHIRSDEVIVVKNRTSAKEVIIVSNDHVSKITPSTSDDQISIKTESSESSGNYPPPDSNRRAVRVTHEQSPRPSSKQTADKRIIHNTVPSPEKLLSVEKDRHARGSEVNGRNGASSEFASPSINTAVSSHANGSKSSPPVTQNRLRREVSDAGSCGSFASVNSDKENQTFADSRMSPGVVLRRKKVSPGDRNLAH